MKHMLSSYFGFNLTNARTLKTIRLIHVPTSKPLAKRQPVQPTPKPKPIVPGVAVPADVAEFFRSLDLANVPAVQVVEMSPNTWEPLSRPL